MKKKESTKIILWILYPVSVLIFVFLSLNLPPEVAIHFNSQRQADLFVAKRTFYNIFVLVFTFNFLTFLFVGWIVKKVPDEMLSLPRLEYWLNHTGREGINKKILNLVYGIGIVTFLFFDVTFYYVVQANKLNPPVLASHFWLVIIIYLITIFAMIIFSVVHFSRANRNLL